MSLFAVFHYCLSFPLPFSLSLSLSLSLSRSLFRVIYLSFSSFSLSYLSTLTAKSPTIHMTDPRRTRIGLRLSGRRKMQRHSEPQPMEPKPSNTHSQRFPFSIDLSLSLSLFSYLWPFLPSFTSLHLTLFLSSSLSLSLCMYITHSISIDLHTACSTHPTVSQDKTTLS